MKEFARKAKLGVGILQEKIKEGWTVDSPWKELGEIYVKSDENGLLLFNYNGKAHTQKIKEWKPVEIVSRGLILDGNNGDVVARPFDKFWNHSQVAEMLLDDAERDGGERSESGDLYRLQNKISYVTKKMDGSLGILYFHPYLKTWKMATRGSFASDQAIKGEEIFRGSKSYGKMTFVSTLDDIEYPLSAGCDNTFLFEIIYPENRIVSDYGQDEKLVLLAVRNNKTGGYGGELELFEYGKLFEFGVVEKTFFVDGKVDHLPCGMRNLFKSSEETIEGMKKEQDSLTFDSIRNTLRHLNRNEEGFVAVTLLGQRYKFKGDDYMQAHYLLTHTTLKSFLKSVKDGETEAFKENAPDEAHDSIDKWQKDFDDFVGFHIANALLFLGSAPESMKDCALHLQDKKVDKIVFSMVMYMKRTKKCGVSHLYDKFAKSFIPTYLKLPENSGASKPFYFTRES